MGYQSVRYRTCWKWLWEGCRSRLPWKGWNVTRSIFVIAAIFAKTYLLYHTVEKQGRHMGPDLSGIASRPKEALLVDILDLSRQVSPDFINYTLVTTDGKLVIGFILSETAVGVTLCCAGEADDIVLRS